MTDHELNELLRDLSQSDVGTAHGAETRLRLAFRVRRRRKRVRDYAMKIAACAAILLGLYFFLAGTRHARPEHARANDTYGEGEFVILPYGQNDVPLEHPVIVRVQLPEAELGELGVTLPALPKDSRVEADLLVGQDGIARAVRVNRRF